MGSICERGHPGRHGLPGGPGALGRRNAAAWLRRARICPESRPRATLQDSLDLPLLRAHTARAQARSPPSSISQTKRENMDFGKTSLLFKNKCYVGHRKRHFKNSECVSLCEASLSAQYFHKKPGAVSPSLCRKAVSPLGRGGSPAAVSPLHREFPRLRSPHLTEAQRRFPARDTEGRDLIRVPGILPSGPTPPTQVSCWQLPLSTEPTWPSWLGARHRWAATALGPGPRPRGGPAGVCPHPGLPNADPGGWRERPVSWKCHLKKASSTSSELWSCSGRVVPSRVAVGEVCLGAGWGTPQPTSFTAASGRPGGHALKAPVFHGVGRCRSRGPDTTATSPRHHWPFL